MSDFTYTKRNDGLIQRSDGVVISTNPAHSDRQLYEAWLAEGNEPEHVPTLSETSKASRKSPPAKPATKPASLPDLPRRRR